MAVEIDKYLSLNQLHPISYAFQIPVLDTGTMEYRHKLGLSIEIDGVSNSIERDAYESNTPYDLNVSDIIKASFDPGVPHRTTPNTVNDVTYNTKKVKVTAYSRTRAKGESSYTTTTGDVSEFYAQRGVHRQAYEDFNFNPAIIPGSDYLALHNGDNVNYVKKNWYYDTNYKIYQQVAPGYTLTVQRNHVKTDGSTITGSVDSYTQGTYATNLMYVNLYYSLPVNDVVSTDIIMTYGWDIEPESSNTVHVDWSCRSEYEYACNVAFLDHNYTWNLIPFNTNSTSKISRNNSMVTRPGKIKETWNNESRVSLELTSDYMSLGDAEEAARIAISDRIEVMMEGVYNYVPAVLLNKFITQPTTTNMYQLKIVLEIAEELPKL